VLNLASTVWIIWVFFAKRLLQLNMFFWLNRGRIVTELLASNSADHMTSPSLCVAKAEKMISVRFRCRSYDHFLRDSSNQWCVITNSWIVMCTIYTKHKTLRPMKTTDIRICPSFKTSNFIFTENIHPGWIQPQCLRDSSLIYSLTKQFCRK